MPGDKEKNINAISEQIRECTANLIEAMVYKDYSIQVTLASLGMLLGYYLREAGALGVDSATSERIVTAGATGGQDLWDRADKGVKDGTKPGNDVQN